MKTLIAATALALVGGAAFADSHEAANPMVGGAEMPATNNIVQNAVNSADHTTLVAAVQAAGLVETLEGAGPFTVFAPVNDAFAALPEGTVDTLLLPENKDQLTQILTCHVVGAEVFSTALAEMIASDGGSHAVETLGGCTLTAAMNEAGDGITLTDENGTVANVTIPDVDQANGVIHVIDAVLTPASEASGTTEGAMAESSEETVTAEAPAGDTGGNPMVGGAAMYPTMNIVENAVNSADHTTLVAAVQAAGLAETLSGPGPFTVFAPVNAAFEALPAGTVDTLLLPENKDQLTKVLSAHVVSGTLDAQTLAAQADADGFVHLQTVSGDAVSVQIRPSGNAYVFDESGNAYRVTIADVRQSNGVIHVVDGVLLPAS